MPEWTVLRVLLQAYTAINLTADFTDAWTWNTKQIYLSVVIEYATKKAKLNQAVIWNTIIQSKVCDLYMHMLSYRILPFRARCRTCTMEMLSYGALSFSARYVTYVLSGCHSAVHRSDANCVLGPHPHVCPCTSCTSNTLACLLCGVVLWLLWMSAKQSGADHHCLCSVSIILSASARPGLAGWFERQ